MDASRHAFSIWFALRILVCCACDKAYLAKFPHRNFLQEAGNIS